MKLSRFFNKKTEVNTYLYFALNFAIILVITSLILRNYRLQYQLHTQYDTSVTTDLVAREPMTTDLIEARQINKFTVFKAVWGFAAIGVFSIGLMGTYLDCRGFNNNNESGALCIGGAVGAAISIGGSAVAALYKYWNEISVPLLDLYHSVYQLKREVGCNSTAQIDRQELLLKIQKSIDELTCRMNEEGDSFTFMGICEDDSKFFTDLPDCFEELPLKPVFTAKVNGTLTDMVVAAKNGDKIVAMYQPHCDSNIIKRDDDDDVPGFNKVRVDKGKALVVTSRITRSNTVYDPEEIYYAIIDRVICGIQQSIHVVTNDIQFKISIKDDVFNVFEDFEGNMQSFSTEDGVIPVNVTPNENLAEICPYLY